MYQWFKFHKKLGRVTMNRSIYHWAFFPWKQGITIIDRPSITLSLLLHRKTWELSVQTHTKIISTFLKHFSYTKAQKKFKTNWLVLLEGVDFYHDILKEWSQKTGNKGRGDISRKHHCSEWWQLSTIFMANFMYFSFDIWTRILCI